MTDSRTKSNGVPIFSLEAAPSRSRCWDLHGTDAQQPGDRAAPGPYLLGILATVVDKVASDFVFGPFGTPGRPRGLMTISIIHQLDSAKLLSAICQENWLAYLLLWQNAGWNPESLIDFVDRLRPLTYRNDLDEDFIQSVTSEYLHKYIADLYTKQGFRTVKRSDVNDFLDIVQRQYSQCDAVLLPAKDAVSRLQVLSQAKE